MKKNLILLMLLLTLTGCSKTYTVKDYRYNNNDDEVYVNVYLSTGHLKKIICAFPPDTDYESLTKVKVGKVKEIYLFGEQSYYCNSIL